MYPSNLTTDFPKQYKKWKETLDPEAIYNYLFDDNKKIISVSEGKPLIIDTFTDLVGQYGSSQKEDEILTGTFDSTGRVNSEDIIK